MKKIAMLFVVTGLVAVAVGCGGDDDDDTTAAPAVAAKQEAAAKEEAAMKKEEAAKKESAAQSNPGSAAGGTTIVAGDSEFGQVLFDSNDQAIYIFENDTGAASTCYGECAAAWPPVFTSGKPTAGEGIDQSLLGTVKRSDGRLQVTYAGNPLYFYVNEGPGEVRCHNVNLNGGFWWAVGPDGERRP
jgi:predicted lipoprotein with Yx(FWY)xxD motif